MDSPEAHPAISREYGQNDRLVEVVATLYDSVSFTRGLGDSGYRLELVDLDCPACNFDRMLRNHRVYPEEPDVLRYWCLSPTCKHFVGEQFSYAQHERASEPTLTDSQPEPYHGHGD